MRCLQHVLGRGALAVGLLVSGGTGALLMPQDQAPARETPNQHVAWIHINAAGTATAQQLAPPPGTATNRS